MGWNAFNRFLTGVEGTWAIQLKTLYSETFKNHKGRSGEVSDKNEFHPKPWKWLRVFIFLLLLSALSYVNVLLLGEIVFPWFVLLSASVIPITVAVFISESVLQEKIPMIQTIFLIIIGANLSFLLVGLLTIGLGTNTLLLSLLIPIIEEICKILPIMLAIRLLKVKRISTAILIGWIIGASFQLAESLGYGTFYGFYGIFSVIEIEGETYNFIGSLDFSTALLRAVLGFGSHAFYGAIEGAGYMFAKNATNNKMRFSRLAFWFTLPVVLHLSWNLNSFYNPNVAFTYIILILIEIICFPIFFYLLDASIRDQKEYVKALSETSIPEPINSEESSVPSLQEAK